MKRIFVIFTLIVITVASGIGVDITLKSNGVIFKLKYASCHNFAGAPAHSAFHNYFLKQEGIDILLNICPNGEPSLSKLFAVKIDLAGVRTAPEKNESVNRKDFYHVVDFGHPKFHHLLVNRQLSLGFKDLKGRKAGVSESTFEECMVHSYLIENAICTDAIDAYVITGPNLADVMEKDIKDAALSWYPVVWLGLCPDYVFFLISRQSLKVYLQFRHSLN